MLALAFVLAREGVSLGDARPLQTTRWAADADGAADLAMLLGVLITAAARPPRMGAVRERTRCPAERTRPMTAPDGAGP